MNKKVRKTVMTAVLAAFVCVSTLLIRVPMPIGGYVNLGDCFLLAAAWILGPVYGAAAAATGSALADLIAGYPVYIPATLVIKAIMAAAAASITRFALGKAPARKIAALVLGGLAAELIMAGGYYLFESMLYGFGAAVAGLSGNVLQGVCGLAAGTALIRALASTGVTRRIGSYIERTA